MKKFTAILLVVMMVVCSTSAMAAGKLNVVQENYHTVGGYYTYGYAYAKVENSGDKPIKVNAGVLEIYDEAGDVVTSSDYLYAHAQYLKPGEYTYVKIYDDIEEGSNTPADYMLTLTGKSDNSYESRRLPSETKLEMGVVDGWWEHNYMYATVTNNTEEDIYNLSVALALLDAEGNILLVEEKSLYSEVALTPGSSIIVRNDISSTFIDHFKANNLVPASVDAIAYYEVELED